MRSPAGLVEVGGTRLFVEDRGDANAPPLLFIHGGPGQGCYDFMRSVGDLLARRLRIIGVDQRGTLRSDPLPASRALTVELLIADFEELRRALGVSSWAVLGHSAGGHSALRYVTGHAGSVSAAIFDCPCWDADLTERHRLPEVARRLAGRDLAASRSHDRTPAMRVRLHPRARARWGGCGDYQLTSSSSAAGSAAALTVGTRRRPGSKSATPAATATAAAPTQTAADIPETKAGPLA
jgi:pimeloyl-ACP methyl ester carboxylesterase